MGNTLRCTGLVKLLLLELVEGCCCFVAFALSCRLLPRELLSLLLGEHSSAVDTSQETKKEQSLNTLLLESAEPTISIYQHAAFQKIILR